jgi:hypothetical protein
MSDLTIVTNNVPRDIIDSWNVSLADRAEFDYLDWDALDLGNDSRSFVRFKGELYDLGETEGTFPFDRRWFYRSHSYFSGVLFRYAPDPDRPDKIDPERIICATYYA